MNTPLRQIVVLGAGVTGLTAAWALSNSPRNRVYLLERGPAVGGLAATFRQNGFSFDIGSHRLHEGYYPEVDDLIRELCGSDLLRRDRRGQIHLAGQTLPYPPTTWQILSAFGPLETGRFVRDFLAARLRRRTAAENFEDFTAGKVGDSLYQRFYKPYACKLYGLSPRQLAKDPAVHRVRKFSLASLWQDVKKVWTKRRPVYLYPARGIGQVNDALLERFQANGGQLCFITSVNALTTEQDRVVRAVEFTTHDGQSQSFQADAVVATVPLDVLHNLVELDADTHGRPAFDLRWRGLRLLYLITHDRVPSEHETHYFPEPDIFFGRVSELNKYSPLLNADAERTVLTLEVPCSPGDATWTMPEAEFAERCLRDLRRLGLLRTPSSGRDAFFSRSIPKVYPVYDLGWHPRFNKVFERLDGLDNLYLIGRTALFLHCNIDHCMAMALKLAGYLAEGPRDKAGWRALQQDFFDYRVHE